MHVFLCYFKPVLSQFLQPGIFIYYCSAGSECENVKCALFG